MHLEYLPRYLSDVVNGTTDTENVFRGRYTLSVIFVAIMRHFNNSTQNSRLLNERLSFLLDLCVILIDTLLLNILKPIEETANNSRVTPRPTGPLLGHSWCNRTRELLVRNISDLCNRTLLPNNVVENSSASYLSRLSVSDDTNDDQSNNPAPDPPSDDQQDYVFQELSARLGLRLRLLGLRLERNLARRQFTRTWRPRSPHPSGDSLIELPFYNRYAREIFNRWHTLPQVQVNDVPVENDEHVSSSRPVRPQPSFPTLRQRHGVGLFRPRFLHPLYGVAVLETDMDDQQRYQQNIFGIDTDFPASICPNHRIQIWNMSDGHIPPIANRMYLF